jgi:hypothetical protein
VVLPSTCDFEGPDCANDHGGVFQSDESTTWISKNATYAVTLNTNIGLVPDVQYGYDTIALGYLGSGTPDLPSQLVGELITTELYTGSLGLSPLATNFSNGRPEVASYMSNLKAQNQIPSLSYAYNAGNRYRYSTALASLTLGGYDASLFNPNSLTFAFDTQSSSDLTVYINSITQVSVSGKGTLLSTTIPAFIDSTTPYLWLPEDVCTQFELQFGITYDNFSGLYLVNDTLHDSLLAQNANITFTLGNTTSSEKVDIVLPYAAFDLLASSPLVDIPTRYFPLKRANTTSQITLGRTFLQEAYLIADYERSNFSVSQMSWHSNSVPDIVPILPVSTSPSSGASTTTPTPTPTSQRKRGVPAGTIIAATISSVAFLLILIVSIILIRHRQKKKNPNMTMTKSPPTPPTPQVTFAPIVHEENCQHCQRSNTPSPEPIEEAELESGSINSGQTSSLGNNDSRRLSTPIPSGLAIAPILVSPLSPTPERASPSPDDGGQNTQVSPATPGPTIPPRFSSLDRVAIPTTYETDSHQVPSVRSGIYELPAREEMDLDLPTTPIESLLQAALDQVIASHNREFEEAQSRPRGYVPLPSSSPPPEPRRGLHSPIYGESSFSTSPTPTPNPDPQRQANSPPRIRIQTQPQPYRPIQQQTPAGRVIQINAPLSRFNPQNQYTPSSPPQQSNATLNNQTQSFAFDTHPQLPLPPRSLPLPPIPSQPRPNPRPHPPRIPLQPRYSTFPSNPRPSTSHQTQHPIPISLQNHHQPPSQPRHLQRQPERIQRRITKPNPNSHQRRQSTSRPYPPPTSPPPMYPLPDLPGLSPNYTPSRNINTRRERGTIIEEKGEDEESERGGSSSPLDPREYSWLRLE